MLTGHDHCMSDAYQSKIQPHLDLFAKGIALIVTAALEETNALLLMYGKAGPKWDPISFSRGSVSSRTQDFLHNGFSVLIDAGADVIRWANEHEAKFALSLIGQWAESEALLLQRLAISGMTGYPSLTSDEKLAWVISNHLVENLGLKNETFALLAAVYGGSGEQVRAELLAQAEAAMNPEGEDYERYEFFNLLSWLQTHSPECTLVTGKLGPIQERHPQWSMREHPDFNSWIGGGAVQAESDSPIPASQIAEMNLEALFAENTRLADVKDMFGDPLKGGFLPEIARTASENFAWSKGIAGEALERNDIPVEIWSALLRGWSTHHTPEEWASVLGIMERLEPIYDSVLYEMSSLLKGAVERKENSLPVDLFDAALARANAAWHACVSHERPLPEEADNWVTVAINRTSGYLLDFYFEAFRLLWPNRTTEQARMQSILQALETAINGDGPASEIARILVTAKASLLADISQDWYTEHVLPLLATPLTARHSEQNWDGYLVWGSWTQAMLPGLIPAYLGHLPEIAGALDERSRMFCNHLAGFAVLGAVDPINNGWLSEFLTRSQRRERMHWVGSVTQILREADDLAKESVWGRWMERYLRLRVAANPIALDGKESGAMCEWAVALESHYAEILELLLAGPVPDVKGAMFYSRLQEAGLLDSAPVLTARFLTALLSHEDGHDLWDLEQVHTMISQLIDHAPTEPALRPLCEQLGRMGSPRALEFQSHLRA